MTESQIIEKQRNKIKRQFQREKTYFALFTSHYFEKALSKSQCSSHFMKPVDEMVNESIEEYQDFKKAVSAYPYDKQILNSFSRWYNYSGFEVAKLKSNIGYIIRFGLAITERNIGDISEAEMVQQFSEIIVSGKPVFHPEQIIRMFLKAVTKFNEIESKIELRKAAKP